MQKGMQKSMQHPMPWKAAFQKSSRACRYYYDRVDPSDYSNREWFVYSLGSYGNRPLYCIGETNDISVTEFVLKRTFPVYTRLLSMPHQESKCFQNRIDAYIITGSARRIEPTEVLSTSLSLSLAHQEWEFIQAENLVFNALDATSYVP